MTTGLVRLLGGVIGGAAGFGGVLLAERAFEESLGAGFGVIGGMLAVTLLGYILASALSGAGSEALRGALIGVNAGANAAVWAVVGIAVVGGVLGAVVLLSLSNTVANTGVYQGVVGWANWLLPMSWLIVGLGFAFLLVSLLGWGLTGGKVEYFRVSRFFVDWTTGTLFVKGGFVANLNVIDTAFNMGNFAFIDMKSTDDYAKHEAGHTLNLAAFGSLFHLIGFVDEIILNRKENAYSERLADSHANNIPRNIPMWI